MSDERAEPQQKRPRAAEESSTPESLTRAVSPPRKRTRPTKTSNSPWQLTWIRDLPESMNQDAVTLKDVLGDPLIAECWQFNYLHDIAFIMEAFDNDTRHLVNVHIVHGFWKREDPNRQMLAEDASKFGNVHLHCAPMPEMFGTHHSKMMILLRHDDTAQVIIHTANMIPKDWTNMTNAMWRSPRLPKGVVSDPKEEDYERLPFGSGHRFKVDLLNYLRRYDSMRVTCRSLVEQLTAFDFSEIKAALIASVPGRHEIHDLSQTAWGWSALKRALSKIPVDQGESEVVVQISSIATLGAKDEWLQKTLFATLLTAKNKGIKRPRFKVVFPTPEEIRKSLDGYDSGRSIHTKIQSSQQTQQLHYLRPLFHHWANDSEGGKKLPEDVAVMDSGRNRAAPHIKTYIRFNERNSIDWAMLTSANLSKQAWGEAARPATGDMRIASWELGILIWPGLLGEADDADGADDADADGTGNSIMLSAFQSDIPDPSLLEEKESKGRPIIGLRIPYSWPLQGYKQDEVPWVATLDHSEPDCKGSTWGNRE